MYIHDPDERKFFQFLLEQEVIHNMSTKDWEVPEEVVLMDVLSANADKINSDKYISAGLRSNSKFVHVPNMQPSWDFVGEIPNHHVWELIDTYHIFPLRVAGPFTWMATAFFHPFGGQQALDLLGWSDRLIAWNAIAPSDYRLLREDFNDHVAKFQ